MSDTIISAVVWPIAVLVLALIFRHQLGAMLQRVATAKLPGVAELSFGASQADQNATNSDKDTVTKDTVTKIESQFKLGNVGNLYWLGHDVMWSIDVLLRGGSRSYILHGLRQSIHHAAEIGLSPWVQRLESLQGVVETASERDLTKTKRDELSGELRRISDQVGAIAEAAQRDFRPSPDPRGRNRKEPN